MSNWQIILSTTRGARFSWKRHELPWKPNVRHHPILCQRLYFHIYNNIHIRIFIEYISIIESWVPLCYYSAAPPSHLRTFYREQWGTTVTPWTGCVKRAIVVKTIVDVTLGDTLSCIMICYFTNCKKCISWFKLQVQSSFNQTYFSNSCQTKKKFMSFKCCRK